MNKLFHCLILCFLFLSCSQGDSKQKNPDSSSSNNNTQENQIQSSGQTFQNFGEDDFSESDEATESEDLDTDPCRFDDGTYAATVYYNNSETGHSATYTLDVEVVDCQVIQINFPNNGYLDSDHISYGDIDENGHAYVDGENGKSYEIQLNQ